MKKYLIYTIISCSTLLMMSCNDWLDVKPQVQVESKELFKKEKGFQDALTACYIKMNSTSLYGNAMTMTALEYMAQHWDHTSGNYREEDKLKDFQYNIQYADTTFSNMYGQLYNTIAQANTILENLATSGNVIQNPEMKKLIEAEALGIRAFCHTDILRIFGQLPNNPTVQVQLPYAKTVSTAMIPYYSYQDYINLILTDINAAEVLFKECDPLMEYTFQQMDEFTEEKSPVELEDNFMGYRRFRLNYYAMEALKARLYMYKGDKNGAHEAALNVINAKSKSGEQMLSLAGLNDLNKKFYALPSECILALSCNEIEANIKELYGNQRLYLTNTHYKQLFTGQATSTNNRAAQVWKVGTDEQGTTKAILQKYVQPEKLSLTEERNRSTKYQVIPLLRLSEMYLIAIETAGSLAEANNLYTIYMEARSVQATPLTAEKITTEIAYEYRREFFAEGQMFFYYKRTGTNKMLWKTDREVTEKDYIVPLPTTELGSN